MYHKMNIRRAVRRGVGLAAVAVTAAAIAVSASPGAAGASSRHSSSASSPFRILQITAESGPYGTIGSAASQAMKAAVAYFNKHGGIDGHKLILSVINDQSNPAQAVSGAENALVGSQKPNAVLTTFSYEASALAPIVTKDKLLLGVGVRLPTYSNAKKFPTVFGDVPNDELLNQFALQHLAAEGYKKIGVVLTTDAFGSTVLSELQPAAKAAHVQLSVSRIAVTSTNATPNLQQLQSDGVKALWVNTIGPVAAIVLKSRTTLGWKVPTLLSTTAGASNVYSLVSPDNLTGVHIQSFTMNLSSSSANKSPVFNAFYSALKAEGPITQPVELLGYNWDGVAILVAAGNAAHSITSSAIGAELGKLPKSTKATWVVLKNGPLSMTPSNHIELPAAGDLQYPVVAPMKGGLMR